MLARALSIMEYIQSGAHMMLAANLVEVELKKGPAHAPIQNLSIVVLTVRTLDLIQRPRSATLTRALSMEDIPLGATGLAAYLAEMELNHGPAHVQVQKPNMMVSPVRSRTLDLLLRPRLATLTRALSMEDMILGVSGAHLAVNLAEMEFNQGPEHVQIQKPNMVVSHVRTKNRILDLLQRLRLATLDRAVTVLDLTRSLPPSLAMERRDLHRELPVWNTREKSAKNKKVDGDLAFARWQEITGEQNVLNALA